MVKKILPGIVFWKITIFLFAYLAQFIIPLRLEFTAYKDHSPIVPYLIWIWGNFDGDHYLKIAMRGYQELEQPFFPLFPIVIRLTSYVFSIPYIIAGIFAAHAAFIASLFVMLKVLAYDGFYKYTKIFLIIVFLFPTSFFYGAVYNDSLFLLLASLCIYYGRKSKWGFASVFGALATLTRLNGTALFLYLLAEYFTTSRKGTAGTWSIAGIKKNLKYNIRLKQITGSGVLLTILIPLALAGYLYYLQTVFGDWQSILRTIEIWRDSHPVLPVQVYLRYIKIFLFASPGNLEYWVAVIEYFFTTFYFIMLMWSWKKIRLSYWLFFLISILIPGLTGTFSGMPRYGLHIYPLFFSLTLLSVRQSKAFSTLYFSVCISLSIIFILLFTRGWFVT